MTQEARRFRTRYQILVFVLPAYLMALLYYGTAWLLVANPRLSHMAIIVVGVMVGIGLSRWCYALGFISSGILLSRTTLNQADHGKLDAVMSWLSTLWESKKKPYAATHPLKTQEFILVEAGEVPILLCGGLRTDTLWISTYTLNSNDPATLQCLIAHECGHAMDPVLDRNFFFSILHESSWLLAAPVAYVMTELDIPLTVIAVGLIHAMLWVRYIHWAGMKAEARADRWAAALMGEQAYAEALAGSLAQHYGMRRDVLSDRLKNMGLDAEYAQQLLDKHYEDTSGD